MDNLLFRNSKFCEEGFEAGEDLELMKQGAKILVIGAGGLGCEILKNLALCGFINVFVIDLDTIELSNLNRQFLFRKNDIGKFKSEVATNFIKAKFPKMEIRWDNKKVQSYDKDFFKAFHLIIGGLDNIEARRWVNNLVHNLVEYDEEGNIKPESIIPFIDGGTEGFRGQSRVIIPFKGACFECTMDLNTNTGAFALCTIAETPRLPEHCIEYIYIIKWKDNFQRTVDKDSVDDVNWIYEQALKRAESYGIQGVTYQLTLGVIKNVIPAIASTNAIIAASTCLEAIKILSNCSKILNNYLMFMGHEGLYCNSNYLEKKDNCIVCGSKRKFISVKKSESLREFIENMKKEMKVDQPSLYVGNEIIYMSNPPEFEEKHRYKLDLNFEQLGQMNIVISGQTIILTDFNGTFYIKITVN